MVADPTPDPPPLLLAVPAGAEPTCSAIGFATSPPPTLPSIVSDCDVSLTPLPNKPRYGRSLHAAGAIPPGGRDCATLGDGVSQKPNVKATTHDIPARSRL